MKLTDRQRWINAILDAQVMAAQELADAHMRWLLEPGTEGSEHQLSAGTTLLGSWATWFLSVRSVNETLREDLVDASAAHIGFEPSSVLGPDDGQAFT